MNYIDKNSAFIIIVDVCYKKQDDFGIFIKRKEKELLYQ